MSQSDPKRIILNSIFEETKSLESYIRELQEWAGFDDAIYEKIMLVLNEAVTNAIVHGNKENPEKTVEITAILADRDKKLSITVKDEGEGFDPASLPDPSRKENLLREGGRGVYLIEEYADNMTYREQGTSLTVDFLLNNND